jgi:PAS domain S-box-containing protein
MDHGDPAGTAAPLRWTEPLGRALVAHSADVILVLTAEHACRFANPALLTNLGYPPAAVLGQDVIPLHHPDDLPRAAAMLAAAADAPGCPATAEVRLRHADGSWRWMEVIATNLLDDPEIGGIVCNLRDITARTEAALALAQALQAQRVANADLQRTNTARARLAALLSHEFKTPLTAIVGFADLLSLDPGHPDQTVEFAATIRDEGQRLARMVADLLTQERLEGAELPSERRAVDLGAIVREAVTHVRGMAPDREIAFCLDGALPPVLGDPERLAQVVINLVGNAIKYSPAGGPVVVATRRDGDAARLDVADRGIGVPPESREVIFDRYRRLDAGPAGAIEGTGLGLPIVREIARLHGGAAWVDPQPDGPGSIFRVTVPLAAAAPTPASVCRGIDRGAATSGTGAPGS